MSTVNRREFLALGAAALASAAGVAAAPATVRGTLAAKGGDVLEGADATALAALVSRKEVKPIELVDAAIARIEKSNPKVNAVVATFFDRARERARTALPEGPFCGVPFLLKDLIPYENASLTFGSVFFRENVSKHSSEYVSRLERSGLVILGRTSTCELGLLPTTEPRLFGPTRNPWNLSRSAGGSSGGAAAAVAAGMVPMAHASDGGGSIRIPASACGLFGLKPSRGRNPEKPDPFWHGLPVSHCVSRSVRDSAALLDVTRGPAPGDKWWAPEAKRPYLEEVGAPAGRLRIGFATRSFTGGAVHADCAAAVESAAKLCEELGHRVEEAAPEIDGEAFSDAFLLLWSTIPAGVIRSAKRLLGKTPPRELFEPFTWALAEHEAKHTPADLSAAWHVLDRTGYATARFHETYDCLLTPVLGAPPVAIGAIDQSLGFEALRAQLAEYVAFTPFFNVTGQPAMSVPLHWSADGLPIGCQFVGRFGDEATLFRLATALEKARPWAARRPTGYA